MRLSMRLSLRKMRTGSQFRHTSVCGKWGARTAMHAISPRPAGASGSATHAAHAVTSLVFTHSNDGRAGTRGTPRLYSQELYSRPTTALLLAAHTYMTDDGKTSAQLDAANQSRAGEMGPLVPAAPAVVAAPAPATVPVVHIGVEEAPPASTCCGSFCRCCCGETTVPAADDDAGQAHYDSVNAGSKRAFYLANGALKPNLCFLLRENHSMMSIFTASRLNEYTRQERLWVFLVVTMLGILPAKLIVDSNWKLMAREDLTANGRRLAMIILWVLLQVIFAALFACFEKLAKVRTNVYCARCALVPTFFIGMLIFFATLFDGGYMECGSAWQGYDPATRGTPEQFYGETGQDVTLEECQSYCSTGCGGVMHYQALGDGSGDRFVSGCKLCSVAIWSGNGSASTSNHIDHCPEKVSPGCPTEKFTLYSREQDDQLNADDVSNAAERLWYHLFAEASRAPHRRHRSLL